MRALTTTGTNRGAPMLNRPDQILFLTDEQLRQRFAGVIGEPHHYLAISGGGADGAFGAGVLCGWTAAGNRPEFTVVTGISTGALIAPFAFLGPDYDDELREFYTTVTTKDILKKRSRLNTVTSDAAASSEPLQDLLENVIDEEMIGDTIRYSTIMVATVPILFVYPALQKYFMKGVMIGAIKG